jgi:NAD(P)-dependent dehydrogenase (short-subunit alcohol dehydrogenase family)
MIGQKVAVVTSNSSGMGYETSLLLARYGFCNCATMRTIEEKGSKQTGYRQK